MEARRKDSSFFSMLKRLNYPKFPPVNCAFSLLNMCPVLVIFLDNPIIYAIVHGFSQGYVRDR